jgi:hypothetical protein
MRPYEIDRDVLNADFDICLIDKGWINNHKVLAYLYKNYEKPKLVGEEEYLNLCMQHVPWLMGMEDAFLADMGIKNFVIVYQKKG